MKCDIKLIEWNSTCGKRV